MSLAVVRLGMGMGAGFPGRKTSHKDQWSHDVRVYVNATMLSGAVHGAGVFTATTGLWPALACLGNLAAPPTTVSTLPTVVTTQPTADAA